VLGFGPKRRTRNDLNVATRIGVHEYESDDEYEHEYESEHDPRPPPMLPPAYQLPAAAFLIAGGLIACFAGYRLFRVVLSIYGFILGALLASSIVGPSEQAYMIVAAVVGGILGALVLNLAYFVGVALIGAGAAALVLHIAWAQFSRGDPPIIVVVIAATLGAVAATQLQRLVIIVASAFGGAWTLLVGVLALMGDKAARAAAAADDVWVLYPLSAGGGRKWVLPVWLVLAIVGTIVQLKGSKGGGGKTSARKGKRGKG
jgi:Domain of unknown function (DUF4203)